MNKLAASWVLAVCAVACTTPSAPALTPAASSTGATNAAVASAQPSVAPMVASNAPSTSTSSIVPPSTPVSVTGVDVKPVVKAEDAFAIELEREAGKTASGNLVLAPASVAAALTMTWGGAKGVTADEIAKALHYDAVDGGAAAKIHASWQSLLAAWNVSDPKGVEISTANRLFGQNGFAFVPAFLDLTRDHYGASLASVDFKDEPTARKTINDWVSAQTAKTIENLITPGVLDADTRLVLVDAMHVKGAWATQFQPYATSDETFNMLGATVKAPTMHGMLETSYAETSDAQIVAMPFVGSGGDALEVDVIVPKTGADLAKVEGSLGALTTALDAAAPSNVAVAVPKLKLDASFDLVKALQGLGVKRLFDDKGADLSGIDPKDQLYISHVIHHAVLRLDEAGAEGAAATAVVATVKGMAPTPDHTVKADHPFALVLRDKTNGAFLFVARVVNPTQA